ncbi:MAG: sulfotransferase [Desulfovibrionaceae bacterium]|nr:sulfotransferase [Desulfovibrionaceae bacterium]
MQIKTRFLIVGTQRTGSTFVASTLSGHSDITCGYEWTRTVSFFKKIQVLSNGLQGQFEKLPPPHSEYMLALESNYSALGFRYLFSSSPFWVVDPSFSLSRYNERLSAVIEFIIARPDIHIIHVVRDNDLDWIASMYLAKYTGAYINKSYDLKGAVNIPISSAKRRLIAKQSLTQELRKLSQNNPYLEVSYEDFVSNIDAGYQNLCKFLHVGNELPLVSTKKQQKRDLSQVIMNYRDVDRLVQSLR